MPDKELKIDLPDKLLTAGDVVGRAVRIARQNWLVLGKFFLLPTMIYWLAVPCAFWDASAYTNNFPSNVSFWIIVFGFIMIFLSMWEVAVKKFALIYYMAGAAPNLDEALKKAQKKMWTVLVLTIPVFIFETIENFLAVISTKLSAISGHEKVSEVFAFFELWLIGAEFLLLLPFLLVIVLNAYYIAFMIFENSSIAKACSRFLSLTLEDWLYVFITLSLMCLVYFCAGAPILGIMAFEAFLPRDALWYFVGGTVSAVIAGPLDGFMSAVLTICGALLYKQVSARREGRDLLDKLQLLEAK